jgi:hypothetical protein
MYQKVLQKLFLLKLNFFLAYTARNSLTPAILDNLKKIQEGYQVEPLSTFLGTSPLQQQRLIFQSGKQEQSLTLSHLLI